MNIDVSSNGPFKVLKIHDPLMVIADLTELKALIEGYLAQGETYIAVNFTNASYLYSGAVSVLVTCYKLVDEKKGKLCILEPNRELLDLLEQMNIDRIIPVFSSEEKLLADTRG